MKKGNRFDNLIVNVPKIFLRYPIGEKKFDKHGQKYGGVFTFLYSFELLPLVLRKYLWYLLHRLGLDERWFYSLKHYWESCLGGITLWGVEDFYFLRGSYRLKFHSLKLPKGASDNTHLVTWQKPAALSFLFDMVYRESLYNQMEVVSLYFKHRKTKNLPILEFGCGTAPISTTMLDFFWEKTPKIYISDIQILAFHYASYKFRNRRNILPIVLNPKEGFSPTSPEKLGAIFCLTVFEHVTDPVLVAKKFHDFLEPGGLLIFDFLKTKGEGMDSLKSVYGREETLKYISEKFIIHTGDLWKDDGGGVIVAAKK